MSSFDKTTLQFLPKLNFHINVLKFVIGCISGFDTKIIAMKNKFDEIPSNPRWNFSASVSFRTLITQHQYRFSIETQVKTNDMVSSQ